MWKSVGVEIKFHVSETPWVLRSIHSILLGRYRNVQKCISPDASNPISHRKSAYTRAFGCSDEYTMSPVSTLPVYGDEKNSKMKNKLKIYNSSYPWEEAPLNVEDQVFNTPA